MLASGHQSGTVQDGVATQYSAAISKQHSEWEPALRNRSSRICPTLVACGICLLAALAPDRIRAQSPERGDRPTIGLVLSGGGARGAAHVGVIQMLDELHIPVDYVAGTSMGAIVGGLYASGMSADELVEFVENVDWSKLLTDRPPRKQRSFRRKSDDIGFLVEFDLGVNKNGLVFPAGLIQGQNLEIALKRLALPVISIDDFDELPIPFRAVATDIVTGEAVVLNSGDLALAMRASMSAPGLFKPVRLDGKMLVDGGVANNLPVKVVQDMGADILIVVNTGFPLLPEEDLGSAFSLTKQMLTILINSRAEEQIALMSVDDILIAPNLGALESQDFSRLQDARQLGLEKAQELAARLATLSMPEEQYLAYRRQLETGQHEPPVIDEIVVENQSRLSPKVIESRLLDQQGTELNVVQLESDISNIYAFDTFETVTYDVIRDTDKHTLLIQATEKSWGPNYLRFGINLEDDFSGNSNYNVAARLTRTEMNQLGGELRLELQVGETPRVFAEFFQPLDHESRWFVNPQIELSRSGSGVFDSSGFQIAKFGADNARISLDGGRQFGNWGGFRFGVTRLYTDSEIRIGPPQLTGGSTEFTSVTAGFEYDTIDRVAVPRSGANLSLEWIGPRETLGSDFDVDIAAVDFLKPQTWGDNTLLHWWSFGSTTKGDEDGLRPFDLGGLFSLSGYAPQELDGRHVGIGRMLYYHRLGDRILSAFDTPVYLGASIEAGNVWQDTAEVSFDNTLTAGSVFIVFDSFLGPLYIAYGAAEGDRQSAYLFLGQTF